MNRKPRTRKQFYDKLETVLDEAYKDALDILDDVLPEKATVELVDKITYATAFRARVPRAIDDESKRCCDRCGGPRGEMWVIHPYFWCWFMPLTEWRSDICLPCFKKIEGVKEWLQESCPELVCEPAGGGASLTIDKEHRVK